MANPPNYATSANHISILKELYSGWGSTWYHVEGSGKEIVRRIRALSRVDKAFLGIEDD